MDSLNVEKITADDEIGRIIQNHIVTPYCRGYVLVGEDRTCIAEYYVQIAEQVKNFEVRNDDVWVIAYPKSGTTWTQEMVWMIANNLDFEGAKQFQNIRFPYFELSAVFDVKEKYKLLNSQSYDTDITSVERISKLGSPRFIKTHLPFSLLPDQIKTQSKAPKIVYVMRNAKDVCVSLYHFGCLFDGWNIDLETFAKLFLAGKAMFGPYWNHVFGYWNHRNFSNILIVTYEDMISDLRAVIRTVAEFLEKPLTEKEVDMLAQHLSFESMKNNKAVNKEDYVEILRKHNLVTKDGSFLRSGTIAKHKEELRPETIKAFDAWIEANIAGTDFERENSIYKKV